MNDVLNDQINVELASAYTYLSMSIYCDAVDLKGASGWLRLQWEEEVAHGLKLIDHIGERGGTVVLKALTEPPSEFSSLPDVFDQVLAHERQVTAAIHKAFAQAVDEGDYASQAFLQWYVNEQVEEESAVGEIISMLKLAGDQGPGLLLVDNKLAERVPV
jgi:ferritin